MADLQLSSFGDFLLGGWVVQPRLNRVARQDRVERLEPRCMDLLVFFARNPKEVHSKERLVDEVWRAEAVAENTLTHEIAVLRKALGDDARSPRFIETIHRRGYRLLVAPGQLSDHESSISRTLSHYLLLEYLGGGGMGVVYRAEDTKLRREVALKFLPKALSGNAEARERFVREARAASALDHPNICTIHEIDETPDGQLFIVMARYEGETLTKKIERGPLAVDETVRFAGQIADGLRCAHSEGIVHRDIKPANLMVTTDSVVKILDFGLAKLMHTRLDGATETAEIDLESSPGTLIGTAAYMSPEQVRGDPADHRSDIFSLGAVLYEMLTGKRPFSGTTTSETAAAILTNEPEPISTTTPGVSPTLAGIVSRCLEKQPDDRYPSADEVLSALGRVETTTASAPFVQNRFTISKRWPHILAVMIAATIGLLVILPPEALIDRLIAGSSERPIRSIAVLPLHNLTGDEDQTYFVDGIHDALISELAGIEALGVTSRTSVIGYRESTATIPQIAEELAVDAVVEGSIMREGNKVAITVQLIDGETDTHIWREVFERDLENVLRLRAEVVRAIAEEIRVVVTPEEKASLDSAPEVNPEAFDLYLRGRHHLEQWATEHTALAVESFQRSLDIDPGYAPAWGGLAQANLSRGIWIGGSEDPRMVLPAAERAARRALALDDRQVEAHLALAVVYAYYNWRWREGERQFRLAIELDPDHLWARIAFANFLTYLGRYEEAEVHAREAMRLAPLSPLAVNELLNVYLFQGRADEAWELILESLELDPHFPQSLILHAPDMVRKGRVDEGLAMADEALLLYPDSSMAFLSAADAYAAAGQPDRAGELVEELVARSRTGFVPPGDLFRLHLNRGNIPLALNYLEQAFEERDPRMIMLRYMSDNPALAPLTSEPRFQEILNRMNFPEN